MWTPCHRQAWLPCHSIASSWRDRDALYKNHDSSKFAAQQSLWIPPACSPSCPSYPSYTDPGLKRYQSTRISQHKPRNRSMQSLSSLYQTRSSEESDACNAHALYNPTGLLLRRFADRSPTHKLKRISDVHKPSPLFQQVASPASCPTRPPRPPPLPLQCIQLLLLAASAMLCPARPSRRPACSAPRAGAPGGPGSQPLLRPLQEVWVALELLREAVEPPAGAGLDRWVCRVGGEGAVWGAMGGEAAGGSAPDERAPAHDVQGCDAGVRKRGRGRRGWGGVAGAQSPLALTLVLAGVPDGRWCAHRTARADPVPGSSVTRTGQRRRRAPRAPRTCPARRRV
jgi:hypothetical protein